MRKVIALAACGILLCALGGVAQARPSKRLDPTTNTCRVFTPTTIEEGRNLFHSVCKSCHSRDNAVGARFIHSESLISRAWNRVFAKQYPACAKDGSWASLNEEQLRRVNDFLFMNSADAYNPHSGQDCG
ncbi:MAG: hypothetical protein KKD63_11450 [Proteobacteria bacterium]|nr:hypothetical protein [Desulfobulbaceae bacterium]MBU4153488.1 hypothetical protein [Pseudomonadota bacterium]